MNTHVCKACGAHFAASEYPPTHCPICVDDRQYVPQSGQAWTTYKALKAAHRNTVVPISSALYSISMTPKFAIGQRALLLRTPHGNVLWDCVPLIDDATVDMIQQLGGISAMAISHPHFYSSMVEWSEAFGNAPVYLHESDRGWAQRKSPNLNFWSGSQLALLDGVTVHNLGGHFPGSSVLHWRDGADGRGALLVGDTIYPVSNRRMVTFMHSYPNMIGLPRAAIEQIVARLDGVEFDAIYAAWEGNVVSPDARQVVMNSAEKQLAILG